MHGCGPWGLPPVLAVLSGLLTESVNDQPNAVALDVLGGRAGRMQRGCDVDVALPAPTVLWHPRRLPWGSCSDCAGGVAMLYCCCSAGARRRGLALRTYAVLPLTDDCGILQVRLAWLAALFVIGWLPP